MIKFSDKSKKQDNKPSAQPTKPDAAQQADSASAEAKADQPAPAKEELKK